MTGSSLQLVWKHFENETVRKTNKRHEIPKQREKLVTEKCWIKSTRVEGIRTELCFLLGTRVRGKSLEMSLEQGRERGRATRATSRACSTGLGFSVLALPEERHTHERAELHLLLCAPFSALLPSLVLHLLLHILGENR